MGKLKFLGRGSAFNVKEGNTAAYIREVGTLVLIDCGESIFKTIIEKGILDDVKNIYVLLTHLHSDHAGSLSSFLLYTHYKKGINSNVYFKNPDILEDFLLKSGCQKGLIYYLMPEESNLIPEIELQFYSKLVHHKSIYAHLNDSCNNFEVYMDDKYDEDCIPEFISTGYSFGFSDRTCIEYSGDCSCFSEEKTFMLDLTKTTKEYILYQDTCLADYPGNVHLSLKKLCEAVPKELRDRVYCMHLDCDELIEAAKAEGFNVVENI